jgi:anti-sigma factor RsiW
MRPCPEIEQVAAMVAGELPPDERAELVRHLQECRSCWAYLARVRWLADILPSLGTLSAGADSPHPTDLELAAYTAGGLARQQAEGLETHLADCDECAHVLGAARRGLEAYEDLRGGPPSEAGPSRLREELALALATWRGRLLLAGAAVARVIECLGLALVAAQTLVLLLQKPVGWDELLQVWPFTALPTGPSRLALFVAVCLGCGLLFRAVARRLYRLAIHS